MKVLVVSNMYPSTKYPTAGVFVLKFCNLLDSIGITYNKSVMTWTTNRIIKCFKYIFFYVSTFLRCIFEHFDIVYIHYASHSSAPVIMANKIRRLRVFTNVHGSDVIPENTKQESFQKYTKAILNLSEKIVVPSEYFKNVVMKKYSIEDDKIFVFPSGGVDDNVFHLYRDEELIDVKKYLHIKDYKKTFTYAGRITAGKGWDTFVKAINELNKMGVTANYLIIGSGNKESDLEEMIKEYHLERDIIRFPLMNQRELSKVYALSDVFVFPTEREGESLGLVALEAMACGVPVIATNFAAPKYYVNDGVNGYKFEKRNFQQLASLMMRFVNDEYRIDGLKQGAIETSSRYLTNSLNGKIRELFSN